MVLISDFQDILFWVGVLGLDFGALHIRDGVKLGKELLVVLGLKTNV